MVARKQRGRLAYLASQYPAPSHTFIRREVSALRDDGWVIDTFSIRPGSPSADEDLGPEAAFPTFVVLEQPLHAFAAAHLTWILTSPARYVRALGIAARHRAPGMRGLLLAGAHFLEAGLLARELDRRDIGHLHNHFANSGATVGMIAAKLAGTRWSFTMHGVSETDFPAGLLLGQKIEAADFVACASWFMRAQGCRAVAPNQWQKLHVVRCGVALDGLPIRANGEKALTSLVCVGRLSPEKGHAGLFQALAILSKSHRELKLRLIGDGPGKEMLEDLAGELGIADRVEFLGARSEASTLDEIAASDLLVLTSFLEGLPVVLMEAMAIGVPVVAPRVAGIPELVDDGKSGLLFTASNWDELVDRISRLAADPELGSALSHRARESVSAEFDILLSAARLSDLFGSLHRKESDHYPNRHTASFGLREAIILSIIALVIGVAVALSSGALSPGSKPLARSTAPGKGQVERQLPGNIKRNSGEHR